jgi:hypothetical protein
MFEESLKVWNQRKQSREDTTQVFNQSNNSSFSGNFFKIRSRSGNNELLQVEKKTHRMNQMKKSQMMSGWEDY